MIYLDNGATTYPKPQGVRQAVARALAEFGANPGRGGFAMSVRTGQGVYDCRRMAADLLAPEARNAWCFSPTAPRR